MLLRVHSGPDPTRFMETPLHGSDRLLAPFSKPDSAAALELIEDDIFLTGSESPNSNPNNNFPSSAVGRRISYRDFGILAALPDRNPDPNPNLIPKLSMSSSSSAMAIRPAGKAEEKEVVHRSSAPVSIPVMNGRRKATEVDDEDEDDDDEMMKWTMLPPHEMVARREGRGRGPSPMTTFSVLEGAGRTLKGRDLRRVRNAVFRKTGFLD